MVPWILHLRFSKLIHFSPKHNAALHHINGILKHLRDECLETKLDPDFGAKNIGVKALMSKYNTLISLQLCKIILSKPLQKQPMSAAEGQGIADVFEDAEQMHNE